MRSQLFFLLLSLQLFFSLLTSSHAISSGSGDGYTIYGRVKIPSNTLKGFGLPGKTSNIKVILNGGQRVRVDVSARNPGKVQAALTENRRALSELVLEPLRDEEYYEVREPFNIMSLVKSPMGLMVGFMVIVVFLMPKLMENIDPEEMRRAQEEMRNQGVPTLSSLLPGAGRSS